MIHYVIGDATAPVAIGKKIILQVCNDIGAWGAGFSGAISARWKLPEECYRWWHKRQDGGSLNSDLEGGYIRTTGDFKLGQVQLVQVHYADGHVGLPSDLFVLNMIAQRGIRRGNSGQPPIRYDALRECLERAASFADSLHASLHAPRIGCGLAGGDWISIEPIIKETILPFEIAITIYDLPGSL